MGFFDNLFKKKECAICGGEIGLLGNRKLEDGNMCKDCAKKLSPFFSERRHSTVEEIKAQLAYREENKQKLSSFNPTVIIGHDTKVYIDMPQKKFIVTRFGSWRNEKPDIIDFSQVTACNLDIDENKRELYRKDKDGNNVSYNPPRYEYSYAFKIEILVNSPYFDDICFELSDELPDSPYTELYRQYEREAHELQSILMPQAYHSASGTGGMGAIQGTPVVSPTQASQAPAMWTCGCGTQNSGKFCQNCGKTNVRSCKCDKCGWAPENGADIPKFCPNCGDPINSNDLGA